jgi:hypothetical protein
LFEKNKKNIFKFAKISPDFLDIVPIKNVIPKWYKNIPAKNSNVNPFMQHTGKICVPFLEAFTTGYTMLLPVDIFATPIPQGGLSFKIASNKNIINERHPEQMPMPIPNEYHKNHYIWQIPNAFEAPPGYSTVVMHPLNRFDLPFYTLGGVVDDFKMPGGGSLPVFFKKDFSGLLPAGTPIAQILLFKRENWIAKEVPELKDEADLIGQKARNVMSGYYKQLFWRKKSYE